jgi:superoxide dismutase, Fe-Mn family
VSVIAATEIKAKPLDPRLFELVGISSRQIEEHYTLYEAYVKKTNDILSMIPGIDRSKANQNYSDFRELKVELSYTLDGVKLHEAYFGNLGAAGQPSAKLQQMIMDSYRSMDEWEADFRASGTSARGWAICAFDFDSDKLYNYIADDHNTYGIWNAMPLLVLDTYEHAYAIDYGVKRPPYIDAFVRNINWDEVNKRAEGISMGGEPRMSM